MTDRFDNLLEELGKILNLKLQTDHNNACAILIRDGLILQMETDALQENLLIGCKIVEVPPGKFRENIFREALKTNGITDPKLGIFSYIEALNTLALFQYYPFEVLTAERLASFINTFIHTADGWRKAIKAGLPAPRNQDLL